MLVQRSGEDPHVYRRMYKGVGVVTTEWYFRDRSRLGAQVMMYRLDPGTSEGLHLHSAQDLSSCSIDDADELYVVIEGEVVFTVDGRSLRLREGDAGYAPVGSMHGVSNETANPARLMLIWSPPLVSDHSMEQEE